MVISGLNDGTDVNFLGTQKGLSELKGKIPKRFHKAIPQAWYVESKKQPLGWIQDGNGLCWVKVVGEGHLSVRDQPLLIDVIMDYFQ